MLEDIKNLVPDLEEIDSDFIFNNLLEKENKKKVVLKKYIKKIVSFVLVLAICVPLSISIYKNLDNNSSIPNNDSEELFIPSYLFEDGTLLGMAAHKEFDNKEKSSHYKKTNNHYYSNINNVLLEEANDYFKTSHPFDYIKILKAYKFTVEILDIIDLASKEIIENSCGLGLLEVVVADFEIYEEEYCIMEDRLISLRGHNGYYTVLYNSGGTFKDNNVQIFSSHIKIVDGSIKKDFTPPILTIFLEENNEKRNICFILDENKLNIENYNKNLSYASVDNIKYVSNNSVYLLFDIVKLPTARAEVKVISINLEASKYGLIHVESNTQIRLRKVYYSEKTEGIKLADLHIGDVLSIEYDILFDEYDPISISANKIELIKAKENI